MNHPSRSQTYYNEEGFLQLMKNIIENGEEEKNDRTGVGTYFSFGETVVHELYGKKIPMMSSRHVGFKTVLDELLFFLRGDTDTTKLKSKIWVGNTTEEFLKDRKLEHYKVGDMGPMYGFTWRYCGAEYTGCDTDYSQAKGTYDQLAKLLEGLESNPSGRRHIISSWIPNYLDQGVLAPCHVLQQYQYQNWKGKKYLNCLMFQRSADTALAAMSFNALSYSILMHMICAHLRQKGIEVWPGKLIHVMGNTHVYKSHIDNIKIQVERKPLPYPELELTGDFSDLTKVKEDQFKVVGYKSLGKLSYRMAV